MKYPPVSVCRSIHCRNPAPTGGGTEPCSRSASDEPEDETKKAAQTISAYQSDRSVAQSQPRQMKAEPSSETNSRSPRVVSKRRMPTRGEPPGEAYSQTPIAAISEKMTMKKIAVGQVQAIQERSIMLLLPLQEYPLWRIDCSRLKTDKRMNIRFTNEARRRSQIDAGEKIRMAIDRKAAFATLRHGDGRRNQA